MNHKAFKSTSKNFSPALGISIGIGVAMILTILLSAGLTSLVLNGKFSEESARICVFIIRAVSVLLGCLVSSALIKEKVLLTVGGSALGYLAILLGFGIIMFDMSFQNFGMGLLSVVTGSLISYLIRIKPLGSKKKLKRYTR